MRFIRILIVAVAATLALPAAAQDKPASNMEILQQKLKADKKLIVADNMELTQTEAGKFWPIYDAYEKDLEQINQRLGRMIVAYADDYRNNTLNDDKAKALIKEALAIEDAELKLKRTYSEKLTPVLPQKKVARFLQIQNKIRAVVKYELAAQVPLVQ